MTTIVSRGAHARGFRAPAAAGVVAAALLLAGCATGIAPAGTPETVERSFLEGRAALAQAVRATGGAERIEKLGGLRFRVSGAVMNAAQVQGYSPPGSTKQAAPIDIDLTTSLDLAKGRFHVTGYQTGVGGFMFRFESAYANGTLANAQPDARIVNRIRIADPDTAREQALAGVIRMMPVVMLKTASTRLATVRFEGNDTWDGRAVKRVGFNLDGNARVTLLVDAADGLPRAVEQIFGDPLTGATTTRYAYHDYHTVDGIAFPRRVSGYRRGHHVFDLSVDVAREGVDPEFDDAMFALDASYREPPPAQLRLAEPLPGLHEVSGAGNDNYRIQFLELADRVVAFEAPLAPAVTRQMIAKFREKVPAKPISHVVLSHFHGDHAGGVRAFAEDGATIVTTADAVDVVRQIATVPPRLAAFDDPPPPAVKIVAVDRTLELGDAARPLTVFELTDIPHVARMLVLADPTSKAVVNGDLFGDNGQFNATFDAFAEWLRRRGGFETVLGTHHPPPRVQEVFEQQARFRAQRK